jgi:signal transduction histidine kinase
MRKELAELFNQEVERYRKGLLYYARKRDWETFEEKAGRLFDFVESIEFRELERRFFTVFNLILAALVLAVIALVSVDFQVHQELLRLKSGFILSALAASSFELYFYIDYRMFIGIKTFSYKRRRDNFIKGIEQDFRSYAVQGECSAA